MLYKIFSNIATGHNTWQAVVKETKALLKNKKFQQARSKILGGLAKHPNQPNLLIIANKVYRKSGSRKQALLYSELLLSRYPDLWEGYYHSAQNYTALKRFSEAQTKILEGLKKFPNQKKLISIAGDIQNRYRESCQYATKSLLKKKHFAQAQAQIKEGLEKIPNDLNLLQTAQDVFCASGDYETSLSYSELLIIQHPDNWEGYYRAAQDLLALKRLPEAIGKIEAGLQKAPDQFNLITIAHDSQNESGNYQKALEYAELLITHQPVNWKGYVRAAKDLVALDRLPEAQAAIQQGLRKMPTQEGLIRVANQVFRASGDYAKALEYAELLITHRPGDWNGYYLAAQDKMVLKDFNGAAQILEKGIGIVNDTTDQKFLLKILAWTKSAHNSHDKYKVLFESWRDSKANRALTHQYTALKSRQCRSMPKPIQYWSQNEIPADVLDVTEAWNQVLTDCGAERIRIWNRSEAQKWIASNTPEFEMAFQSAPHFAAESDVFRLAYTKIEECIYLDSDLYPKKFSAQILALALDAESSTFFCWSNYPFIQNSFFISRPSCPIFPAIRDSLNGWNYTGKELTPELIHDSFGPGAYNETIKAIMDQSSSKKREILIKGVLDKIILDTGNLLICNEETFAHMSKPGGLAYKKTDMHWLVFCENSSSSKLKSF